MLVFSQITVQPHAIKQGFSNEKEVLTKTLCKHYPLKASDIKNLSIKKFSIDARKKDRIKLFYTVVVELDTFLEQKLLNMSLKNVQVYNKRAPSFHAPQVWKNIKRPVVVGGGCAGLFCALELAHAGLRPLLIERGEDALSRQKTISQFNEGAQLNGESNIQFGMGGAGTFSDGKLTTGTKSPYHQLILQTFVRSGASERILFDAKPHIGSDVLPYVVESICKEIRSLGGEILYNAKLIDLEITHQKLTHITYVETSQTGFVNEVTIPADHVVLCCGHSARDVYKLLHKKEVALERKTFAMGVRIEHLQSMIDASQYGSFSHSVALGAAPYKLVSHTSSGRSAFTFCMCPGGYVVAATSEKDHVVTNGMSLSNRAGINANSGFLSNVQPEDLEGSSPLAGIYLQEACEKKAFELGEGNYKAPAMLAHDFLKGARTTGPGSISPTYPRGVTWCNIEPCLPDYITQTLKLALPDMDRKLRGFNSPDAVLTAIESRSSSPVRVVRGDNFQSINTAGLWPCGEGAGYAGGIMSAATDGLRVARALIAKLSQNA